MIHNDIKAERVIKIGLAISFFICLLDMPYGYYQLVRFFALVGFAILAYLSLKENKLKSTILYVALAILFQPFFSIVLGRLLWNIVDVIVGIALLGSIFIISDSDKGGR